MSQFLLFPVFFPFLAGPFAYWIGCWYEKARNTFVMSAAALELFLVLTLWTKPELAQATAVVEGFCGMGIQLRAGGFHTLMALLTATGWMAATVFCREYMVHVHKRNRFYLFWLMTLGATMGVFLSGDLFTAFLFFEVMSFTSFVLVIQTEEYPALKAGETYLAVAVIGGLAALTGLFLLYRQLGTLSLDAMAAAAAGAVAGGLARPGVEQPPGVGDRCDASAHGERDVDAFGDSGDQLREGLPPLFRGADVEVYQFVGPFGGVFRPQLHRVADVAQPDEVDALDGLSLADVEAGDYAFGKHLFSSSRVIRPS